MVILYPRFYMKRTLLCIIMCLTLGFAFGQTERVKLLKIESYPTPANTHFFIEYSTLGLSSNSKVQVQIANLLGAKVLEMNWEGHHKKVEVPVSELSEGVYFYTLFVSGESLATRRLVIRR